MHYFSRGAFMLNVLTIDAEEYYHVAVFASIRDFQHLSGHPKAPAESKAD
jgi:hypothetical protein